MLLAIRGKLINRTLLVECTSEAFACKLFMKLTFSWLSQMSVTDPNGAIFAASLGCETVVVGRELSILDIAAVRSGLDSQSLLSLISPSRHAPEQPQQGSTMDDVTLEAFVHGALCVSYSGQCFSSEAWGGRSANRYVIDILLGEGALVAWSVLLKQAFSITNTLHNF